MGKSLITLILIGFCFLFPLIVRAEESCNQILEKCREEAERDHRKCIEYSNDPILIGTFELECEMKGHNRSNKEFQSCVEKEISEFRKECSKTFGKTWDLCDEVDRICKKKEKWECWSGIVQMKTNATFSNFGTKDSLLDTTFESFQVVDDKDITIHFYIPKKGKTQITAINVGGHKRSKIFLKFEFKGRCRKGEPWRKVGEITQEEVEEIRIIKPEHFEIDASVSQIPGRSLFLFSTTPPVFIFPGEYSRKETRKHFCTGKTEPPVPLSVRTGDSTLPFTITDDKNEETDWFKGDKTVKGEGHYDCLIIDCKYPVTTTYKWWVWRTKCR